MPGRSSHHQVLWDNPPRCIAGFPVEPTRITGVPLDGHSGVSDANPFRAFLPAISRRFDKSTSIFLRRSALRSACVADAGIGRLASWATICVTRTAISSSSWGHSRCDVNPAGQSPS